MSDEIIYVLNSQRCDASVGKGDSVEKGERKKERKRKRVALPLSPL